MPEVFVLSGNNLFIRFRTEHKSKFSLLLLMFREMRINYMIAASRFASEINMIECDSIHLNIIKKGMLPLHHQALSCICICA